MWRKIAGPFKEFGAVAGALYAADRILRRFSPRLGLLVYEMMAQPISGRPLLPSNLVKGLELVEIGRGHPDIGSMPVREGIVPARFEQGARCLGLYRQGTLIGYMWFCRDRYDEDEMRATYHLADPQRSVFDFDFYLFPEHRVGLGFMALWNGANRFLHDQGILYTFSRLTRFNVASRRAHAHLGWKCVGNVVCLQAGNVELTFSTLKPFVALTWSRGQRIDLVLAPDVLHGSAASVQGAPS